MILVEISIATGDNNIPLIIFMSHEYTKWNKHEYIEYNMLGYVSYIHEHVGCNYMFVLQYVYSFLTIIFYNHSKSK